MMSLAAEEKVAIKNILAFGSYMEYKCSITTTNNIQRHVYIYILYVVSTINCNLLVALC